MILTGPQMEALVDLIDQAVDRPTLTRIVRFRLDKPIENIVEDGQTKINAIFKVIDYAARLQRAKNFIEGVAKENATFADALRRIVNEAERAEIVAPSTVPAVAVPDPLAPFFPYDVPFVDRQDLSARLGILWSPGDPRRVLAVRGDRYSGRSFSWLRIIGAASAAGVGLCKVDVSRNPGSWTIPNFVDRVASLLRVDRGLLKDSLAQGSTQSAALVNALVDRAVTLPANERWCIVFDGLDRPGVDPAILELVEDIIDQVLDGNLPFLSVIVLGYGDHPKQQTLRPLLLTEKIRWLQEGDLQTWLDGVVRAAGKVAAEGELKATVAAILAGRMPPFDSETMDLLRDRVKTETVALLHRLP